jgi:hypothetical protein
MFKEMLKDKLNLVLIASIAICGIMVVYSLAPAVMAQDDYSNAIHICAQDYSNAVSTITFPIATAGATVSQPFNNFDGSGSSQAFGDAGVAKPVVTLVNTADVAYTIYYNISTFTNGVVSNEYYVIKDKGASCVAGDISNAVSFGLDQNTSKTIGAASSGDAAMKDLYLKVVLSGLEGVSGSSTLTILGESP